LLALLALLIAGLLWLNFVLGAGLPLNRVRGHGDGGRQGRCHKGHEDQLPLHVTYVTTPPMNGK
jgi:hypothetical protein